MNDSHAEEFQSDQDNVYVIGGIVEETRDVELDITYDTDHQIFDYRREIRFDLFYMQIRKKTGPTDGNCGPNQ